MSDGDSGRLRRVASRSVGATKSVVLPMLPPSPYLYDRISIVCIFCTSHAGSCMWCTSQNGIASGHWDNSGCQQILLKMFLLEPLSCIFIHLHEAQLHFLLNVELKFHAPREQYLLSSINFKASFPAQCGILIVVRCNFGVVLL